jgi:hypothetical protein
LLGRPRNSALRDWNATCELLGVTGCAGGLLAAGTARLRREFNVRWRWRCTRLHAAPIVERNAQCVSLAVIVGTLLARKHFNGPATTSYATSSATTSSATTATTGSATTGSPTCLIGAPAATFLHHGGATTDKYEQAVERSHAQRAYSPGTRAGSSHSGRSQRTSHALQARASRAFRSRNKGRRDKILQLALLNVFRQTVFDAPSGATGNALYRDGAISFREADRG